jgi:hypothetical protein
VRHPFLHRSSPLIPLMLADTCGAGADQAHTCVCFINNSWASGVSSDLLQVWGRMRHYEEVCQLPTAGNNAGGQHSSLD